MKNVFLIFFITTSSLFGQTLTLLEYTLNPDKPKAKAELKDTFLVITSHSNKMIDLEKYELKKYSIKRKAFPDTSSKPKMDDFIKSYQFKILKGKAFYYENDLSSRFSDSTCTTYAFCYNYDNLATYMNYYYTLDNSKRLIQYKADCYAQKDFVEYKYSDTGDLIEITDDGRHVTIEYAGKSVTRIYHYDWNNEKKQYYPVSFLEVKTN